MDCKMCGGIGHADLNFYSIVCCVFLSVVSGPIGCFLNWNRLSGYSDGLAHSAIFGVSLSFLLGLNNFFGVFASSLLFAFFVSLYSSSKGQIKESVNFIMSRTFVAAGLILCAKLKMSEEAIESALFGSINHNDTCLLLLSLIISLISGLYILIRRKKLFLISINSDIASSEGVNINKLKMEYIFVFSAFISIVTILFGSLMSVSMIVGPSSIARCFSYSMVQMTIYSSIIALFVFLLSALFAKILSFDVAPVFSCIIFVIYSFSVLKNNILNK